MKWWKVLATVVGAPVVTAASNCIHANINGQHCAFTVGNVLGPAVPVIVAMLAALFTKSPRQP